MVVGRTKFLFLLDLFVGTARLRAEVAEGVKLRNLQVAPESDSAGFAPVNVVTIN